MTWRCRMRLQRGVCRRASPGGIATEGDRYLALPEAEAVDAFTQLAVRRSWHSSRQSCAFGVEFDEWFSEAELHASGALTRVIGQLARQRLHLLGQRRALLRSTALGDEEDRLDPPHRRPPTWPPMAHTTQQAHAWFDRVIDILRADHHSYAARVKALLQALGISRLADHPHPRGGAPDRGGAVVRTSGARRASSPDDIVAEVGRDTARFLFLTCRADRLLNFDIDQARQQSRENPAYAVQWAHARLSLLRTADTPRRKTPIPHCWGQRGASLRCLLAFPGEVTAAAAAPRAAPATVFALGLADEIHAFCDDADARQPARQRWMVARRALAEAARIVLGNTLRIPVSPRPTAPKRPRDRPVVRQPVADRPPLAEADFLLAHQRLSAM